MPPSSRPARSRRERPAKLPLTRSGIVDTALGILRDEGLNKVTMRRIAAALDTGPASLYVYVRDTEDLHAQILDALLAPVTTALTAASTTPATTPVDDREGGDSWRDRLRTVLWAYRDVLFAHPELARMSLSTQPSGPNYLALLDTLLGLLREGGATDGAAAWGVDLLLLQATAVAAEHSLRDRPNDGVEPALVAALAAADPARYPEVARIGTELISGPGPDRADWSVDVMLDGILSNPRPLPRDHAEIGDHAVR